MIITSTDNAKIVACRKLADKKYRRANGSYLVEGERLIADAIRHGAIVTDIFVKESVADKFAETYLEANVVADKTFAVISDTVNSQGIVAVLRYDSDESLSLPLGNCLVLDNVQDPGNAGTLIRTAAATGFDTIYAVNSVDLYSPKVLRSAMSAHFCVKMYETHDYELLFGMLSNADCQIVCADMDGTDVFTESFPKKVALVVGNEGNGLSDFSKRNCNKVVSLPMKHDFESLNVAVAGSVLMYQVFASQSKLTK